MNQLRTRRALLFGCCIYIIDNQARPRMFTSISKEEQGKPNAEVRKILKSAGKVLAVFQGHSHRNDVKEIGGIHYCTLVAMVEGSGAENNGYSLMEIEPTGTIHLSGFRKQQSRKWEL